MSRPPLTSLCITSHQPWSQTHVDYYTHTCKSSSHQVYIHLPGLHWSIHTLCETLNWCCVSSCFLCLPIGGFTSAQLIPKSYTSIFKLQTYLRIPGLNVLQFHRVMCTHSTLVTCLPAYFPWTRIIQQHIHYGADQSRIIPGDKTPGDHMILHNVNKLEEVTMLILRSVAASDSVSPQNPSAIVVCFCWCLLL